MEMTDEVIARIDNLDKNKPSANKTDDFMTEADLVKGFDGIDANFKRRITRMNKAYTGQDGAKSKQLFPEQDITTAYGLFDVVLPPYNLDELAFFFDNSFANHAAINAKVANTVGLGYGFIMSDIVKARIEEIENVDQRVRAQRKVERAKSELSNWLEELNDEDTFTHVLEKAMTDYEATGNGYIEIGRKNTGEIGYIGHIPATTVRVRRMRDGYVQIVNQRVVFFKNFQDKKTVNPVTTDSRPNELIHIKKYSPKNTYYGVPDVVSAATSVVGDQLAAR